MDKMKNSAKYFFTGSKVAHGIFNAAAWICGVVAVLIWFLPESAFFRSSESLSFGPVSITLMSDGMLAPIWIRVSIFEQILLCFIVLLFACKLLRVIQNILEPMSQGQPFKAHVAVDLKKLAWLCLTGGAVYEFAKVASTALVLGQKDLMRYFNPAVVKNVALEYTLDIWFLPVFILLMLLSHVFAYGEQLQQLSDETL